MRDVRAGLRRRVLRQRARVLRAMGREGLVPGLLSIVVPAYNVEAYIDECLLSLRRQDYGDVEIVVVDDGGPDGSRAIAEGHAAVDRRVRVVSRPNGGLSAARNTGVAAARGEFVTFMDADDLVTSDAYAPVVESLLQSGSDFAVFSYRRLRRGSRAPAARWIREAHVERRIGIALSDYPDIMVNALACSKVFRRDFYEAADLRFPEGMAYEDQPVTMRAFARARAFDVLPHVGLEWRVRDDGSSISQQHAAVANIRDHTRSMKDSLEELRGAAAPEVVEARALQLLRNNMPFFTSNLVKRDPEYWAELRRAVELLVSQVSSTDYVHEVAAHTKVLNHLILADEPESAARFLREVPPGPARYPTRVLADAVHVDYGSALVSPGIDPASLRLSRSETQAEARATKVTWTRPGRLRVEGWAYVRNVDASGAPPEISISAVSTAGQRVPFEVEGRRDPSADLSSGMWVNDVSDCGFVAELDISTLPVGPGRWAVDAVVRLGELVRSAPVMLHPWVQAAVRRPMVDRPRRVVSVEREHGRMFLSSRQFAFQAESITRTGEMVRVSVSGPVPRRCYLAGNDLAVAVAEVAVDQGPDGWVARIDLRALTSSSMGQRHQRALRLVAVDRHGAVRPVLDVVDGDDTARDLSFSDFAASRAPGGAVTIVQRRVALRVDDLTSAGREGSEELLVDVRAFGAGPGQAAAGTPVLLGPGDPVTGEWVPGHASGEHRMRFALTRTWWGRSGLALPPGQYQVGIDVDGEHVLGEPSETLAARLPEEELLERVCVRVEVFEPKRPGVRLVLSAPLRPDERSRRQQGVLQHDSRREVADQPSVFFRALYGEVANGNGLGVHEELRRRGSALKLFWSVRDHSVPVPDGGEAVVEGSREWHEAMATSRYHFVDVHQLDWFRRPTGQDLVQTMHGYPYKLMGHDWWDKGRFPVHQITNFDRRARDWTWFVSPAAYATPLLEHAFLAPAESQAGVLEIGYPRNDVLLRPESVEIRRRTRELLGLRPDQVVVMYAPTFRDYLSANDNTALRHNFFDPHLAVQGLPSHYVVLMRGHAFHARLPGERESDSDRVVDVTDYPDVNDLILASDAAILDYSSLRFDYSLVDKPMIFLVPDLREYDALRGGVIPYEPTAPGPHVRTTEEVVEQLVELESTGDGYTSARARFRADYVELEDGRAAERLVDSVFGPRGDTSVPPDS